MSLYVGSNTTEKVFHIYNSSESIQKEPFSGTSFHSSLPYLRLHSVHRFTPSGSQVNASQGIVTAYKMNYTSTTNIPDGDYSIIIVGYYNGVRYTFPTAHGDGYFSNIAGSYYGSPHANAPAFRLTSSNSGYTARCGYADYGIPAATMFNVAIFDYIDVYVITELPQPIEAADIKVSGTDILINNISIFNSNYVHVFTDISARMNDYDTIIAVPYGGKFRSYGYCTSTDNITHSSNYGKIFFQFINSFSGTINSIEVTSNPTSIIRYYNSLPIVTFTDVKPIRTSFFDLLDINIHNSGTVYAPGTTYLGSFQLGYITNGITILNYTLTGSLAMIADLLMPLHQANGTVIRLYAGHYQDVYGIADVASDTVKCYITNYASSNIQSSTTLNLFPYRIS